MSEPDSTPVKKVSAPIRMDPALQAKVSEAVELTGLSQAEIMRLALAIGLEDLKRVNYDIPALISQSARPDLEATARRGSLTVVPAEAPAFYITRRGSVAAGGRSSADVTEEEMPVGKSYAKECYALRVLGHSMEPKIPDGSTIVVKTWKDGYPKKGTVVVYNDGHGATLKVYDTEKRDDPENPGSLGKVPVLRSLNPEYTDVEPLEGGKIDAVLVEVL